MGVAPSACVHPTAGRHANDIPRHYRLSQAPVGLDSPSATCRNSLTACAALHGKEIGSATGVLKVVLDVTAQKSIEEALEECANQARSEVLLRYEGTFEKTSPVAAECKQETKDARGRRVTWAMRLGTEMHEAAQKCAQERLGKIRSGGFSLEQRYRIDLRTKQKKLVSHEEERLLETSGNGGDLRGTLKPDVVIHSGDALDAQAVYDFKFPCVNTDRFPGWSPFPDGHPFSDFTQGQMYRNHIAPLIGRVAPRLGTLHG